MIIRLQQTGHRESRYERPNQTWVCGAAAEGRPCRLGPDRKGRCPAGAEAQCTPRRDGDRYHCTRPDSFGGACEPGPLPDGSCCRPEPEHPVCRPRLSIRARRGRLNVAVFIGAIGAVILAIAGPWRLDFVSPGELASVHRAFVRPPDAPNDCAICHTAAEQGPLAWISGAIGAQRGLEDSRKCLDCHFTDNTARTHALKVHGIPLDMLHARAADEVGERGDPPTARLALASLAGRPPGAPLACATCHSEHRGRDHDLAFMDDTRCQVCHRDQFRSFSSGHPGFRTDLRHGTGIAFDHGTHQEHFGERSFACLGCHEPDAGGRVMRLRPFETSCTGCHYGGSRDHHGDQIAKMGASFVVQLPGVEFESDDVSWPADLDTEVQLPPLMRLLLAGDDEAVELLVELQDAEILDELEEPDKVALTSAITRLVAELLYGDPQPRIARALGVPAMNPTAAALADELTRATGALLEFKERWLPEPGTAPFERDRPPRTETGWHHDPDEVAVGYGVATHADRFVKTWLDALLTPHDEGPAAEGADTLGARRAIRERIARELSDSFGTCLRCHEAGRWEPADREVSALGDRRPFEHGTHLRVFGATTESCDACHRLSEPSPDRSARRSRHGFLEYAGSDCANCHRPGRAADSCLTCHRYHVLRP